MSGTVGDEKERSFIHEIYGIDFFEIPRHKEYRFYYDQ
jgi:hypothetical protein